MYPSLSTPLTVVVQNTGHGMIQWFPRGYTDIPVMMMAQGGFNKPLLYLHRFSLAELAGSTPPGNNNIIRLANTTAAALIPIGLFHLALLRLVLFIHLICTVSNANIISVQFFAHLLVVELYIILVEHGWLWTIHRFIY